MDSTTLRPATVLWTPWLNLDSDGHHYERLSVGRSTTDLYVLTDDGAHGIFYLAIRKATAQGWTDLYAEETDDEATHDRRTTAAMRSVHRFLERHTKTST